MKKIIALLLVLVVCVGCLVACGPKVQIGDTVANLIAVMGYTEEKATAADFNVPSTIVFADKGVTFNIEWVSSDPAVVVTDSNRANMKKIDIPASNDTERNYTLTAKISGDGQTLEQVFTFKLPVIGTAGAVQPVVGQKYVLAMVHGGLDGSPTEYATGKMGGYYLATSQTLEDAANVYVEAAEGGFYIYAIASGAKKYITVKYESGSDGEMHYNINYSDAPANVYVWNADVQSMVTVVGDKTWVIGTDNDKTYNTFSAVDITENPFVAQFIVSTLPDQEAVTAPTINNVTPVAGEKYNLILVHSNLDYKMLYPTGNMEGYYLGTTETLADTINVTLEETTGGYYLAATVGGAKKYINIYKNGTYINIGYQDEASAVYTYDATLETVVTDLEGTQYAIGTSATGSYTTLSAVKTSNNPCVVKFLASTVEDQEAPTLTFVNVSDVVAGTDNETYSVKVTVLAITGGQFIAGDATGAILVYTAPGDLAVGDTIDLTGTRGMYNKAYQLKNATWTKTGTTTVNHGNLTTYDATTFEALKSANNITPVYASVSGVLSISGTNYNIAVDGATAVGSILKGADSAFATTLADLDGKPVTITGYYTSVSSSKYINFVLTAVEEVTTSDAEKLAYELGKIELNEQYDAITNLVLPSTPMWDGTTITWAIKTEGSAADATLDTTDGYKLTVPAGDAAKTVILTVTISRGSETPVTKDITVVAKAKAAEGTLAVFEFGDNGTATHNDGSSISGNKDFTSGTYTLTVTDPVKVSSGARDALGNSCLKLGTGSATASFSFTVGEDVKYVVIKVAKYKSNASVIDINGTQHTLTKNSNDGEYDEIVIDTTTTKTITVTTTDSGKRAMINSITYLSVNPNA